MAKFKVGDRVRCVKNYPGSFTAGRHYTVAYATYGEHPRLGVTRADHGRPDGVLAHYFAPTTAAPAIVALIEGGQPKPATRPYVHENRDLAAKEAARLADVNKGQEFGVYELVTTRKVERTYDHEWQRLAAAGELILAIKALRAHAGVSLSAAKSAVKYIRDAA